MLASAMPSQQSMACMSTHSKPKRCPKTSALRLERSFENEAPDRGESKGAQGVRKTHARCSVHAARCPSGARAAPAHCPRHAAFATISVASVDNLSFVGGWSRHLAQLDRRRTLTARLAVPASTVAGSGCRLAGVGRPAPQPGDEVGGRTRSRRTGRVHCAAETAQALANGSFGLLWRRLRSSRKATPTHRRPTVVNAIRLLLLLLLLLSDLLLLLVFGAIQLQIERVLLPLRVHGQRGERLLLQRLALRRLRPLMRSVAEAADGRLHGHRRELW
mmetsp:Transcript_31017/g.91068  ORF Transcript_31017/g.91068 Transcript_31017/m.91068 type:complete len:275 (+) Transcript_31017:440-1264(+)